jgi:hypothetical protein
VWFWSGPTTGQPVFYHAGGDCHELCQAATQQFFPGHGGSPFWSLSGPIIKDTLLIFFYKSAVHSHKNDDE